MDNKMGKGQILKNGELLQIDIRKSGGGKSKVRPRYEDVEERLISEFNTFHQAVNDRGDEIMGNTVVARVKLAEGFVAPSYEPNKFFEKMDMEVLGSNVEINTDSATEQRVEYVSIQKNAVPNLTTKLRFAAKNGKRGHVGFKNDVSIIDSFEFKPDIDVSELENGWDGRKPIEISIFSIDDESSIRDFFSEKFPFVSDFRIRTINDLVDSPFFMFAEMTIGEVRSLATLNSVRALNTAEMRSTRTNSPDPVPAILKAPNTANKESLPIVGVFDGGIEMHKFFNDLVNQDLVDETIFPKSDEWMSHGSAVAGMAIYGDIRDLFDDNTGIYQGEIHPKVRVYDLRVVGSGTTIDAAVDYIQNVVPKLDNVNVFNISFGPERIISDNNISFFTAVLDVLAYKYDKIFVIAVGNNGENIPPYNRVQEPADAINALSVGSFTYTGNEGWAVASYSASGPGREAAKVKPEVLEYGGDPDENIVTLGDSQFSAYFGNGTSFSAPVVARKLAQLMSMSLDITPLLAKALLVHESIPSENGVDARHGFGKVPDNVGSMLVNTDDKITVLYDTVIDSKDVSAFEIPIPVNLNATDYKVKWTVATMVEPNPNSSDAYSNTAVLDTVHFDSNHPVSAVNKEKYKDEHVLRKTDMKWDTIVRKSSVKKRSMGIVRPRIKIQNFDRGNELKPTKFGIVLTIESFGNTAPLEDAVTNEFGVLQPITLSNSVTTVVDV
ncbi:S8 family peptidase [Weissella confusa]|uniref:S8 family peptidase n=1 Tax=Weissella confusa TaxID=1583 RepID=UPI0022E09E8C|nr:S8 family peptidase [Weissella confusa]